MGHFYGAMKNSCCTFSFDSFFLIFYITVYVKNFISHLKPNLGSCCAFNKLSGKGWSASNNSLYYKKLYHHRFVNHEHKPKAFGKEERLNHCFMHCIHLLCKELLIPLQFKVKERMMVYKYYCDTGKKPVYRIISKKATKIH